MKAIGVRAIRLLRRPDARLVSHTLTYGAGRALSVIGQLAIVAILSRLGEGLYLSYSLIVACAIAATNLSIGWYRQALLRDASASAQGAEGALGPSVWAGVALGGVLTASASGLVVESTELELLLASGCFGATYGVYIIALSDAQGGLRPWKGVGIELWRVILTALLPLLLSQIIGVSLVLVLASGAVANAFAVASLRGRFSGSVNRSWRSDLAYGLPLATWLSVAAILQFSDRWVLAERASLEQAAAYAITYDLVGRGASTLLLPLITAAHPLIMAVYNSGDRTGAAKLMRQSLRAGVVAGAAIVSLSALFVGWGETLVPGADSSWPVVMLLASSGVAWQLALIVHKDFEMRRLTRPLLLTLSVSVLVNLGLCWWVAPWAGSIGVAAVNLASILIYVMGISVCRKVVSAI